MPITDDFLIHDISILFSKDDSLEQGLLNRVRARDREAIADLIFKVATELSAQISSLDFPESHKLGQYKPSRNIEVALRYLSNDVVSAARSDDANAGEVGLHAFGASVAVLAGLLDHLRERDVIP